MKNFTPRNRVTLKSGTLTRGYSRLSEPTRIDPPFKFLQHSIESRTYLVPLPRRFQSKILLNFWLKSPRWSGWSSIKFPWDELLQTTSLQLNLNTISLVRMTVCLQLGNMSPILVGDAFWSRRLKSASAVFMWAGLSQITGPKAVRHWFEIGINATRKLSCQYDCETRPPGQPR